MTERPAHPPQHLRPFRNSHCFFVPQGSRSFFSQMLALLVTRRDYRDLNYSQLFGAVSIKPASRRKTYGKYLSARFWHRIPCTHKIPEFRGFSREFSERKSALLAFKSAGVSRKFEPIQRKKALLEAEALSFHNHSADRGAQFIKAKRFAQKDVHALRKWN